MKRWEIRRAYDNICPDAEAKNRMLEKILSAASESTSYGKEKQMKQTNWKKLWLIAAVISVAVFLMGCAVILYTLEDLQIGEYQIKRGEILDSEGNVVKEFYTVRDVISLQGIRNSPSQMAAQEWHEFESNYDNDNKLLNEADRNPISVSHDYDAYFVYTQEMVEKIDEIARKYNLQLAGEFVGIQRDNPEIFYESLGIPGLIKGGSEAVLDFAGGYFYACGNFKAEFKLYLNDENATWKYPISGSVRYCGKDYLDTVFAHITTIDDFEQWTYTLSDGTEVLIIKGPEIAYIFCDRETAFLSVWLKTVYSDEHGTVFRMSAQDVEQVAMLWDFTVAPVKPNVEEANRRVAEAYLEWKAEQDAMMEAYEDPFAPKASYAEKVQTVIDNGADPDGYYYALYDINKDGIEDLFLGSGPDSFGPVYTMYNSQTYMLLSFGLDRYSYLCENGVILHHDPEGNPKGYYYYKIGEVKGNGEDAAYIDAICYDSLAATWTRVKDGDYGNKERITHQEAMDIIEAYGSIDLNMKPISEFAMN